MEIIFDEKPGEIYDIFNSLWFINNYDYAKKRREDFGIFTKNEFDEVILSLGKDDRIDKQKLNKYFGLEMEPIKILPFESIWQYPTIEQYLEAINSMDEFQLRKLVIYILHMIIEDKDGEIEDLNEEDACILKYMEDKDISGELKWELYLLLNNKKEYLDEFLDFIGNYYHVYKKLEPKRSSLLGPLNNEIRENLKYDGMDYLNKKTNNIVNFGIYEKIYITTSATLGLAVMDSDEKICYVVIGPYIKDFLDKIAGEDLIENSLLFLRNISENSKFSIIKLLLRGDHYGQEIAEALNLTKATVSHHMNYLVTANIVNVQKDGVRLYYSLNKDKLRQNIMESTEVLKSEFEL